MEHQTDGNATNNCAFYQLEFSLITEDTVKRFRKLCGTIIHSPTYLSESIDFLSRTVEAVFTALIVTRNIVQLTPMLTIFCLSLTLNMLNFFSFTIVVRHI